MSERVNINERENPRRGQVLVTGADSFTGEYLLPELTARGWQVIPGVRLATPGSDYPAFDLADTAAMTDLFRRHKPAAVIHLAAISFVAHGDVKQIYDTNVQGTLNLLTAIADAELTLDHLVIASSAAVYGDQSVAELHENLTPSPRSDYGISKLAAEHIALTKSTAKNLAITRPFNYTGVGQAANFLIPKLVSHFVEKKPAIELGNIDVAREFNDVRWVAQTYAKLLELDFGHQTLNLCSGNAFTLSHVLNELEDITGHRPEVQVNPAFVRENDPALIKGSTQLATTLGLPKAAADRKGTKDATAVLHGILQWMCDGYESAE